MERFAGERRFLAAALFVATGTAVAACGQDSGQPAGGSAALDQGRDALVDAASASGPSVRRWRVGPVPTMVIADARLPDGRPLYGIVGATTLSDGTIAIANAGTAELRYFDAQGRYRASVGGSGQGPGEFDRMITLLALPGDSLLLFDRSHRLTRVAPSGELVSTSVIGRTGARAVTRIHLIDPETVLLESAAWSERAQRREGLHQGATVLALHRWTDGTTLPLGTFLGEATYVESTEWFGHRGSRIWPAPFAVGDVVAAGGGRVFVGRQEQQEIDVFDANGVLIRVLDVPLTPRPVTPTDRSRYLRFMRDELRGYDRRRSLRRLLRAVPFPDAMPVFRSLRVCTSGDLWVQRYSPSWEKGGVWDIIRPDGRRLAVAEIPHDVHVLYVGWDHLLVRRTGEHGVEEIARLEIFKD